MENCQIQKLRGGITHPDVIDVMSAQREKLGIPYERLGYAAGAKGHTAAYQLGFRLLGRHSAHTMPNPKLSQVLQMCRLLKIELHLSVT